MECMPKQYSSKIANILAIGLISFILFSCLKVATGFEITGNEPLELWRGYLPFSTYINPLPHPNAMPDHGLLFPVLVRAGLYLFKQNLADLRFISSFFYIFSFVLLLYLKPFKNISPWARLIALILLFVNIPLFYKSNLLNPYSFSMCMTVLFFGSHFTFKPKPNNIKIHALLTLLACLSFFTALLPVTISLFLLVREYRNIFKRYYYLYISALLYVIVKLTMIIQFRFITRHGGSHFYNTKWYTNLLKIFELFNIQANSIYWDWSLSNSLYNCSILLYLITIIYFISNLFTSKNNINIFLKYYLSLMIISYFAMNLTGAREIRLRYYFNLLPLFYISYAIFLLNLKLQKYRLIHFLLIFTIISTQVINVRYYYTEKHQPLESVANLLLPIVHQDELICFSEDLSYNEKLWKLAQSGKYRSMYSEDILREINSCKKMIWHNKGISHKKSIFIVSFKEPFTSIENCFKQSRKNCITKAFITLLQKNFNHKVKSIIVSKSTGQKVYITKYTKQ
jgi:hypothetical protein